MSYYLFWPPPLTLQLLDLQRIKFCLLNGHFVETRIVTGLPVVKGTLSTKLSTANVDI